MDITLIKHNNRRIQYYNHTLPTFEISNKKESPVTAEPVSSKEALGTPPVGDSITSNIPLGKEESKQEQLFSARRQESLREMLDNIKLVPPNRLSPRQRAIADWGDEMGMSVVFFKGDPSLHGFHQDGVTFLNVDSEITPQWTFWHEAMHWMKANNPDIYNDLVEAISSAEGFTKEQLDAYRREIGAPDMSDADVIEEMIADALPDVRRRVPLLRELGRRDAGVVQRVVAWIRDVMRRFHDHFHTPKGGLTSAQCVAMTRAFGNLVGSIRDAEGKAIFRIENEGARITLRGGKPLPAVKFSLDKAGREGDNKSRRNAPVETRNQAITDSVTSLFRTEVDAPKESGLSEQEIARVLGDENSDLRMRVLAPWLRQYNQFQARYPDKRGIVNRIEGREATDRSLSNEEISRRFDTFKARMERMIDDAGLVYAECAYQRAGRPSFVGFHSWQRVEQSIREYGGNAKFKERPTTETKTSLNTKHLESQGAFSMPKFSARTKEESPKGDFGRLKEGIRGLVGVKAAENLELPGRVQRTLTLSQKDLVYRCPQPHRANGRQPRHIHRSISPRQRRVHAYRSPQPDGRYRRQPDSFGRSTSFAFHDTGANRACQRRKIQSACMARYAA